MRLLRPCCRCRCRHRRRRLLLLVLIFAFRNHALSSHPCACPLWPGPGVGGTRGEAAPEIAMRREQAGRQAGRLIWPRNVCPPAWADVCRVVSSRLVVVTLSSYIHLLLTCSLRVSAVCAWMWISPPSSSAVSDFLSCSRSLLLFTHPPDHFPHQTRKHNNHPKPRHAHEHSSHRERPNTIHTTTPPSFNQHPRPSSSPPPTTRGLPFSSVECLTRAGQPSPACPDSAAPTPPPTSSTGGRTLARPELPSPPTSPPTFAAPPLQHASAGK